MPCMLVAVFWKNIMFPFHGGRTSVSFYQYTRHFPDFSNAQQSQTPYCFTDCRRACTRPEPLVAPTVSASPVYIDRDTTTHCIDCPVCSQFRGLCHFLSQILTIQMQGFIIAFLSYNFMLSVLLTKNIRIVRWGQFL
jgi:hypothetical protein